MFQGEHGGREHEVPLQTQDCACHKGEAFVFEICESNPRDLKINVLANAIKNDPVATKEVNLAEAIFGKDIGHVKGHSTRPGSPPIRYRGGT